MQKRKLSLDELQVESFVTSITSEEEKTVQGGATTAPCLVASVVTVISVISLAASYIATKNYSCLPSCQAPQQPPSDGNQ
jgi:acyl-CoA thioesterase